MRSRSPMILIIFAVVAMAAAASVRSAGAQATDPGIPGHGSCMLISSPAVSGLSGFSFDTFMIERASRLMTATSRWQPVNSARLSHVTRVQSTVARTSAPR